MMPSAAKPDVLLFRNPATPPMLRSLLLFAVLALLTLPGCFSNNRNQGEKLYAKSCAGCHGDQGQGLGRLIPPLAGADYLARHRAELPCILRYGQHEEIVVNGIAYHNVMPGNDSLTVARMTNLLNYIENHWGNKAVPRTIRDVQQQLDSCRVPTSGPARPAPHPAHGPGDAAHPHTHE